MKTVLLYIIVCFISVPSVHARQPFPESRPKLDMSKAIQKATEFASKEKNLTNYYMDRVWLAIPNGQNERMWIVSWSPDGIENMSPHGWFIVTVDMEGNVSKPINGVHWNDQKILDTLRNNKDITPSNLQDSKNSKETKVDRSN
jgi:hypothetical protein